MKPRRAAIVLFDGNRVLLMRRLRDGRTYYTVPGGQIEAGESPEEAAARELAEEAGLQARIDGLLLQVNRPEYGEEFFFVAHSYEGTPSFANAPENAWASDDNRYALEWVEMARLAETPLLPAEVKNHLLTHGDRPSA